MTELDGSTGTCPAPKHDLANLIVSCLVLLGVVVSHSPHIIKLLSQRSAGYSPLYLFFGNVSAQANTINIVMLQWKVIQCCGQRPARLCAESLLGIIQIGVQWGLTTAIQVLFIIRFPQELRKEPIWKQLLRTGAWTVFLLVANVVACGVILDQFGADSNTVTYYAGAIGIVSMSLGSLRYVPQILHTWKAKSGGVISIPGLCLQIPGNVVWVYTLAVRPGTNWTTWIRFLLEAILMCVVLSLCIFFKCRERRTKRRVLAAAEGTPTTTEQPIKVEADSSGPVPTTTVDIPPDEEVKTSLTDLTDHGQRRRTSASKV